jgi:VWFA-related protein
MSISAYRRVRSITALFVAAAMAGGVAQDQAPTRPTFRTEVNYVRVDVYPTRDGVAVTDLRENEFELFEDNVRQRIEQFEHIIVRGQVPQEVRREPNTIAESREMLSDARARVFVLFLDTYHVDMISSRRIGPLIADALDEVIGADDLIAVMTPGMPASDLTFARRTVGLERVLEREWWGDRWQEPLDDTEMLYTSCYAASDLLRREPIAPTMIARRREQLTLDALDDLVTFLRDVREERKAILAITPGWRLFQPDSGLAQATSDRVPPILTPGVDPRTGGLTTRSRDPLAVDDRLADCERDRLQLAAVDHEARFRRTLDLANWANASFYPVDPRGLTVAVPSVDADRSMTPAADDAATQRRRINYLRMLAEQTDGTAIVNTNEITPALRRVAADLSSYYLLGYYSTNTRPDGRFRSIQVRVNRPGVQVRARRGYLAPAVSGLASAPANANTSAASVAVAAERRAIELAVGSLAGLARELPVRLHAASGWTGAQTTAFWVVAETGEREAWKDGGEADVTVRGSSGAIVAGARVAIPPGTRSFRARVLPEEPLPAGDYVIRVQIRLGSRSLPLTDSIGVGVRPAPEPTGALLVRRGPATGNRDVATADARVRRNEQLRVEIPASGRAAPAARLLDRTGRPLAVPLTAAVTEDGDGTLWQTAQLAIAPLAPGDYLIEVTASDAPGAPTLVGFRVVP